MKKHDNNKSQSNYEDIYYKDIYFDYDSGFVYCPCFPIDEEEEANFERFGSYTLILLWSTIITFAILLFKMYGKPVENAITSFISSLM